MRYIKKEPDHALSTCDICYKSDCDFIRETGALAEFWYDTEDCIAVCDICKKSEESKDG